jgi:hypothetical protein
MLRNVHPNMVMIVLQDLLETPLYKNLNVTIYHQWRVFFLHINSKFETQNYENSLLNNFDFESEEKHYTPTYLIIHFF